jgi:hypothetical protein
MPERQTVSQVQQIGKETTPGTGVAATRRLGSISLAPGVAAEANMFRPQGAKFATVQALNREWTEGDVSGQPTYDEVIYPLAGVFGAPTTSQLMDSATATGAYQHVFSPKTDQADTPLTFTLEQGDATQAEKMAHLLFTGFSLDISRAEVSMGGSFFAQAIQKAITLTAGLSLPAALNPILPGHFSLYTAATAALLGTTQTQLLRVVSASPAVGDKYAPAWFVNAANASFGAYVEPSDGPSSDMGLTVEADAAGMVFLDRIRDGQTIFLRLEAKGGPNIYNAGTQLNLTRRFAWDMAIKAREVAPWSDEDGIYGLPFTFQMAHDTTWGKSQQITVVNTVPTL